MESSTNNAYQAPEADLSGTITSKPVLEFERFSTWYVFLLSAVTLGIYGVYWLYSRSQQANALSNNRKADIKALYAYMAFFALSMVSAFFPTGSLIESISWVFSIANLVAYVMTAFSLRWAVAEIINEGQEEKIHLGGVMTFFFSYMYFQYKINEAIDVQK